MYQAAQTITISFSRTLDSLQRECIHIDEKVAVYSLFGLNAAGIIYDVTTSHNIRLTQWLPVSLSVSK